MREIENGNHRYCFSVADEWMCVKIWFEIVPMPILDCDAHCDAMWLWCNLHCNAMPLSSKISALSHQSSFLVILKSCGFKRCCWKCHSAIYQIKGISSHMITLVELLMYAAAQINWANVLRGLIGLIWFVWMIGKVRERRLVACPQQFWLISISVNNDWSSHLSATKHLISWEKLFPEVTN